MRSLAISVVVGFVLTAFLGLTATFTDTPAIRAVVRPFALVGFVLVNSHQGSLVVSLTAMFLVFTLGTWALVAIVRWIAGRGSPAEPVE